LFWDEIVTWLNARGAHAKAVEVGTEILNSDTIALVFVDEDLLEKGWEYFCNRSDKTYSLTDCISFVGCTTQFANQRTRKRAAPVRKRARRVRINPLTRSLTVAARQSQPTSNWIFKVRRAPSFVVMEERGLTTALTFDHHFKQAGFSTEPAPSGT